MPLRDHFHSAAEATFPWDAVHGSWPGTAAGAIKRRLPPGFAVAPHIHFGSSVEIDVAVSETDARPVPPDTTGGGVGTLTAPVAVGPPLELDFDLDLPLTETYEVRVYDVRYGRQLVAAIEIVSPANKDRPDHRRAFAGKCAGLLQEGVAVTIVDVVTSKRFNLAAEVFAFVGRPHAGPLAPIYVATLRPQRSDRTMRLAAAVRPLIVGQPLPTVPVWLDHETAVPLDLDATYEAACDLVSAT